MLSMIVPSSDGRNLLSNDVLDLIAECGSVLNSSSRVRPHVQLELATIDRGKEVLS